MARNTTVQSWEDRRVSQSSSSSAAQPAQFFRPHRSGQEYILGASHVLARNDDGSVGDTTIQPGLIDSSCSTANTTTVANLSQFVNLESPTTSTPFVDAALAQVISGEVDPSGTILQLGSTSENSLPTDAPPHAGTGVAPSLGPAVAKSGPSTGLTCSPITAINGVMTVQYQKGCGTGASFTVTFSDLVLVGIPSGSSGQSFSADGDSGSLLVTQATSDPVALLVASSDTDTVAAPVSDVLAALADPSTSEQPVFVGTASTNTVAACSLAGPAIGCGIGDRASDHSSHCRKTARGCRGSRPPCGGACCPFAGSSSRRWF
jgi:hypothetical protein